ncbi:ferredoxin reductase family protein [Clostridium saccharobutylicum]|uniref:2-halobenzoate 1,2-dioxygenase electron transfer component n=1 Tax=Clostridium saccharobutylicum TaxID=169679 RepID=A0A1S8NI80_CLOSA|nr:ferric reductase-like transmembrane domain-containing protein [Clostridium saccharobutylicum]OOM16128.1 2-halobenzoate 1,2-dioxygenase electron transfer component [Clostridium saccharobutylicum]
MKNKSGNIIILSTMILTWILWLFAKSTRDISSMSGYSQLIASFALVAFAFVNFISTRHKVLDYLFDGLDKSYIYHRYLSILALILVVIHNITISMGKHIEISQGIRIPKDPYAMYGAFSMYLFIILIAVAILGKKLNYERWKTIHKFMFIPYAFGIYHYYGSATYAVFAIEPFSIWLNIINLLGIISVVYSIFFYEKTSFKYVFKVKNLQRVANGTLEITGSALKEDIKFKPGQFAFLKILDKENKFKSHPFTISQAPKKGELQFTIKTLGDDTRGLFDTLKVGDKFEVSGPHGKFDYKTGAKNQIWIAGGIGVTPFRSFSEEGIAKNFSIDFFYAYNNAEEGAYVDELLSLANDNLRVHLFNSKEKGFLSVQEICKYVKTQESIDIYFCGSKPMRESLRKQFKNSNLNINNFHYEHFQFK